MAFAHPRRVRLDDGDASHVDLPILDREMLDEHVLGDVDFLLELVRVFNTDSAATLAAVQAALCVGDASGIEHGAHRLKGSLGALAALAAADAARRLEAAARAGDLAAAAEAWDGLRRELVRLGPELERATRRRRAG
jgi:HPt (histidine-containing phosphotransfer) domain-containing protein